VNNILEEMQKVDYMYIEDQKVKEKKQFKKQEEHIKNGYGFHLK
jgi:predicted RNA-binding protein with EMAP domain